MARTRSLTDLLAAQAAADADEPEAPAAAPQDAAAPRPRRADQARTALASAQQANAEAGSPAPAGTAGLRLATPGSEEPGTQDPPGLRARTEVIAAHDSAKTAPRTWTAYTLNLPATVMMRLISFLPDDQDSTGLRTLAACHYVQAALARLPADVEAAAALGVAWQQAHIRDRGAGMAGGSGTRLHRDTALAMRRLASRLRALPYSVHLWEVAAAAMTSLLDELGAP